MIPKESAFNMIYGTLVGIALFVVIVILCWMLSTKLERDKQRKKREEIVSPIYLTGIWTAHFQNWTVIKIGSMRVRDTATVLLSFQNVTIFFSIWKSFYL